MDGRYKINTKVRTNHASASSRRSTRRSVRRRTRHRTRRASHRSRRINPILNPPRTPRSCPSWTSPPPPPVPVPPMNFGSYRVFMFPLHEVGVVVAPQQVALREMHHEVVHEHERDHGLDHRDRAGHHAGVVASPRLELDVDAVAVDGVLRARDRGRGLERNLELDDLAVGDAALDPPRAVRARAQTRLAVHVELVVVLATRWC